MSFIYSLVMACAVSASIPGQPGIHRIKPWTVGAQVVSLQPKYKIAILDDGYDPARATAPLKLCKDGHYDYHTNSPNLGFTGAHGTYISNIVAERLKDVDYCAEVYAVFADATTLHADDVADAVDRAIHAGVTVINISIATDSLNSSTLETQLRRASELGITVFMAAGNHGMDLDKNCWVYPACFRMKDEVVVGAQDRDNPKVRDHDSNYGKKSVDVYAPGTYEDDDNAGFGTSFAAPRALADYILFLERRSLGRKK